MNLELIKEAVRQVIREEFNQKTQWRDLNEMAEFTNRSKCTIRRWASDGKLLCERRGRKKYYRFKE